MGWFVSAGYIHEPRLSLLAKCCLNIVGHKYEEQEQYALAALVQKRVQAATPNRVTMGQYQRQAGIPNPVEDKVYLPKELQKPSVLGKVRTPEFFDQL